MGSGVKMSNCHDRLAINRSIQYTNADVALVSSFDVNTRAATLSRTGLKSKESIALYKAVRAFSPDCRSAQLQHATDGILYSRTKRASALSSACVVTLILEKERSTPPRVRMCRQTSSARVR